MKYFCNAKLEALRNMELHVGKTLTFAGIVSNFQRRTAKNGKDWAIFTLEGFDESYEFKIFGEEYLKFYHFLYNNQFVFIKVLIKEGWVNKDTGKKSEPRLQFTEVKQLQDVLTAFAKKLVLLLNIKDLKTEFIHKLSYLFQENKGDNTVTFEIMELEKTKRLVEVAPVILENEDEVFVDENEDSETEPLEIREINAVTKVEEVEEIKVVTKLTMPSRKLKIRISNELLVELEKMQVNFKLN
jgi:DNA polymerase-3 subunit alpha